MNVLEQQKKGLNVQLPKRSQDFWATKQRTILLMEADFNINNKAMGADAMRAGKQLGALARDNYGGCKGLRGAEVSVNQLLLYDSVRARRGRMIVNSNDLKGCFDAITHIPMILGFHRLGVPLAPINSMIEAIQEMEHYICTALGTSEAHYGNDPTKSPPAGTLQVNGAGVSGWQVVCGPLASTMSNLGFGYKEWTIVKR